MEITIVSNLNSNDIDQLLELYKNEFWCNKRRREGIEKMLNNTDIIIAAKNNKNELVGFIRVLTDYVYKATIFDLIVHPEWRGRKIGKLLMENVLNHNKLKNVEHFDLNCLPEMFKFYEQWAFTADVGELGFMRRFNNAP